MLTDVGVKHAVLATGQSSGSASVALSESAAVIVSGHVRTESTVQWACTLLLLIARLVVYNSQVSCCRNALTDIDASRVTVVRADFRAPRRHVKYTPRMNYIGFDTPILRQWNSVSA